MKSLQLNQNYKLIKPKLFHQKLKLFNQYSYVSKSTNELNLIKLESHLKIYGTISKPIFNKLLNEIKLSKHIDKNLASIMLKSCSLNFIDVFPQQRQSLLNYLFYDLFVKKTVNYDQEDYEIYMTNTKSNRYNFDPFKISNEINQKNISANIKIHSCLIQQLCESNDIRIALMHLNNLIQNKEISIIKLENYKLDKNEDELFDSLLNSLSKVNTNLEETSLFNPIISFYCIEPKNFNKAIELFKSMCKTNIKPNSHTYFNLIYGYLNQSQLKDSEILFNKVKNDLTLTNLLSLYKIILEKSTTDLINKDILNVFSQNVLNSMQKDYNQQDRLVFIDHIFHLCSNNHHSLAFNLLQNLFHDELVQKDPILIDNNDFKINLANYFCKSLIEYDPCFDLIKHYATILDGNALSRKPNYLKNLIFYSLRKPDFSLSMSLIEELDASSDKRQITFNYFLPFISNAAKELDRYLASNQSMRDDPNFEIKYLSQYRTIQSVIDKMIGKYKIYMGPEEINAIIKVFICKENGLKSFLRFSDLIYLKRLNSLDLFYSLMYCLLNLRLDLYNKQSIDIDSRTVKTDFQDMFDFIRLSKVDSLQESLVKKVCEYVKLIIDKNLIYKSDLNSDNYILKVIEIMFEKSDQNNKKLLARYANRLKNYLLSVIEDDKEKQAKLTEFFNNLFIKFMIEPISKANNLNSNKKYQKESIKILQQTVAELKSQDKDYIPALRRLIVALCNKSYEEEGIENPIEKIENLLKELPNADLTPLLCQELALLYSTQTFHINKAKHYFDLMMSRSDVIPFEPNKFKLITYLDILVNNKIEIQQLIDIFKKLSWSNQIVDRDELKNKIKQFLIKLYRHSNPKEYKDLVESMFESNFINQNVMYADLVMLKLIESKSYNDVLDYFKLFLNQYKLSLLEVFVLKLFLTKTNNKLTNEDENLGELLKIFGKFYNPITSYNILLIAFISNKSYSNAQTIYENNLDRKLDLNVLNRCVNQLLSNKMLYNMYSTCFKNFLKWSIDKPENIQIKTILSRLENKKKEF